MLTWMRRLMSAFGGKGDMPIAERKVRPNWIYAEETDNQTTEAADAVLPDRGDEDHDEQSRGRN